MKRLALKTGRVYYTPPIRDLLSDVDERLVQYFDDILERGRHAQDEPYEDPNNRHNVYEILCAARFLRLYSIYDFDARKVRQVIRLRVVYLLIPTSNHNRPMSSRTPVLLFIS